jgi:hypothetical protein
MLAAASEHKHKSVVRCVRVWFWTSQVASEPTDSPNKLLADLEFAAIFVSVQFFMDEHRALSLSEECDVPQTCSRL